MLIEDITFFGHPNILSLHHRTIEITKDKHLTLNGDCIIGVNANKSCKDFTTNFKDHLKKDNTGVEIEIVVEPYSYIIKGKGNSKLTLDHPHDIVLRKSNFICNRTVAISCNSSSVEIPRKIINLLKEHSALGLMRIIIE